jgi:hypothetical protein
MQKIERADSTSYQIEMMFHLIKDENELNNITTDIDPECLLEIAKILDPETNTPMVFFMVKTALPAIHWMKYVAPVSLLGNFPTLAGTDNTELLDVQAYALDEPDIYAAVNESKVFA